MDYQKNSGEVEGKVGLLSMACITLHPRSIGPTVGRGSPGNGFANLAAQLRFNLTNATTLRGTTTKKESQQEYIERIGTSSMVLEGSICLSLSKTLTTTN